MNQDQANFFYSVIKPRLIDMAIDGTLPSDMTTLDAYQFDEAAKAYNNSGDVKRGRQLDALSHYICDDEDRYQSTEEALTLLEAQAEIDGDVFADDIVLVWEPLEGRYTVDSLLELLP